MITFFDYNSATSLKFLQYVFKLISINIKCDSREEIAGECSVEHTITLCMKN